MLRRLAPWLVLVVFIAGCNKKDTPTAPSEGGSNNPPPATPTRIIRLSGDLTFGAVQVGQSKSLQFRVNNDGNSTLTFTGLTANNNLTSVMKASPTSGSVPAGGGLDIAITFTPLAATGYGGVISVTGDQTSGNNGINTTGSGTLDGIPLWTQSGTGANVFDIPTRVTRVRITGDYGGFCENFIVHIAGRGVVNEILGSCGVGSGPHYEGTHAISGGGLAEVLSSTGINWTFTEVR